MRPLLIAVLALMEAFSLFAADPAGTWKGTMETQMGATAVAITIEPGAVLAGTVTAAEYKGAIENAKLAGDKISFETTIEAGKLAFEGTVAGEEMKLNVTGTQGDKYRLICKRQK